MKFVYNDQEYEVIIIRKISNKNTYIRVKNDLSICITTNTFTTDHMINKLIKENNLSIIRMIENQLKKKESNTGFYYLGKCYDTVYVNYCDISFGENKVFLNKNLDIDKWYKKRAKEIFLERLNEMYNNFCFDIPYPSLKIRKMTTRWGVCNTKLICVTLNLELIKRDIKYLDYVIVHELSHLIEANHSSKFWSIVEKNCPDYKKIRKEMKFF